MPHGEFDFAGPVDQAIYALKPGQIPDDTFVTQQGLDQQTEHLGAFMTQQDERDATANLGAFMTQQDEGDATRHLGGMGFMNPAAAMAMAARAGQIADEARRETEAKEAEAKKKTITMVAGVGLAAAAAWYFFLRK
jgi:hypothetical protein